VIAQDQVEAAIGERRIASVCLHELAHNSAFLREPLRGADLWAEMSTHGLATVSGFQEVRTRAQLGRQSGFSSVSTP
jgi:hypothetical protein